MGIPSATNHVWEKWHPKHKLVKKAQEMGLTNVYFYWSRSEGWWLECDQYDDFISMDSKGVMNQLIQKFSKK